MMTEFIEAPVPYIIGVSKKVWSETCLVKVDELASDVIIFDVDNDQARIKEDMPPLPEPCAEMLIKTLKGIVDSRESELKKLRSMNRREREERIQEIYWAHTTLRVKQIFLNFFLFAINNYLEFFIDPSQVVGDSGNSQPRGAHEVFYLNSYVEKFNP